MRRSANRDAGRVPGRGAEGRGTLRQCAGPPAASQWDAVSIPARAPSPLTPPLEGGAARAGRGARERLKRGDRWAPPARAPNGRAPARGGLGASPQSRRARQDPWRAPGPTSPLQHRAHGIQSVPSRLYSSLHCKALPHVQMKLPGHLFLPLPRVLVPGRQERSLAGLLAPPRWVRTLPARPRPAPPPLAVWMDSSPQPAPDSSPLRFNPPVCLVSVCSLSAMALPSSVSPFPW